MCVGGREGYLKEHGREGGENEKDERGREEKRERDWGVKRVSDKEKYTGEG